MSYPLFLGDFENPKVDQLVALEGDEAHHAVSVRRVCEGERVLIATGAGQAVVGPVVELGKRLLRVRVEEVLQQPEPELRMIAVQALPKGDRAELAVAAMTEVGVCEIWAWQAERSIVRWRGERGERALAKWQAAAREATKQSRRFRVPKVRAATTSDVAELLQRVELPLVLHEEAAEYISDLSFPKSGTGVVVIGPEGSLTAEELASFKAAGARSVLISDGVLRTSTAGCVALGQLAVLRRSR